MNKLFELNIVNKTKLLSDLIQPIKSIASMLVLAYQRAELTLSTQMLELKNFLIQMRSWNMDLKKRISELKTSKKIQASQVMDIRKRARIFTLSV